MKKTDDPEYIPPEKLRSKNKPLLAEPIGKVDTAFGILDILFFIPRLIMRVIRIFD